MPLNQEIQIIKQKFSVWKNQEFRNINWPNHGKYGRIKMHEDVVDFVHGIMIGLLLGLISGFIIMNLIF